MKRVLTAILSVFLSFVGLTCTTNTAFATDVISTSSSYITVDDITYEVVYVDNLEDISVKSSRRTKRSVSGIAIFVAGILTGYIVDGVVIATTGKASGEWVSVALKKFHQGYVHANSIRISPHELGSCNHYAPGQPC